MHLSENVTHVKAMFPSYHIAQCASTLSEFPVKLNPVPGSRAFRSEVLIRTDELVRLGGSRVNPGNLRGLGHRGLGPKGLDHRGLGARGLDHRGLGPAVWVRA